MNPFFTIIVPVYNVEKYLNECIDSVINQTFTNWELLLVDDGSNDGSSFICDEYASKDVRVTVFHKQNGGASDSRNYGLDKANGEYILFLDSDDYWNDVDALKLLSEYCLKADIVMFGCTDFNIITGETIVSRNNYNLEMIYSDKKTALHYLMSNKLIPGGPTIFAFKSELVNTNKIRFKVGIQNEDYDFVLSLFLCASNITALNNPFYMYRQGRSDSVTGSSDIKMIYGIAYTVEKWVSLCDSITDEVIKKDYLNYIAFIYSTGFVICGRMNKSERRKAIEIMKKHKYVLSYSYWKKPTITKYAIKILGINAFSKLASKYYDKTHIQSVNR